MANHEKNSDIFFINPYGYEHLLRFKRASRADSV